MAFCACPAGRFVMSNVKGQEKSNHEVTITRPFWMTKYLVTAEQWRDSGKYDCEGMCRKVEAAVGDKFQIAVRYPRCKWIALCDYLTKTYGTQLPKGYVFRLPTESELEYASKAGEDWFPKPEAFDATSPEGKTGFAKLFKKNKKLQNLGTWDDRGLLSVCFCGGRMARHTWGFFDLWMDQPLLTLDEGFYDEKDFWDNGAAKCLDYADRMIDPCGWVGKGSKTRRVIARFHQTDRRMLEDTASGFAHIVVGPDLVAEKMAAQAAGGNNAAAPIVADVAQPKPVKLEFSKSVVAELMGCPAGEFMMGKEGCNAETSPRRWHRVKITRPYWMSKFTVTHKVWNVYQKYVLNDQDKILGGWDRVHVATRGEVDGFLAFLNKRFRRQIPKGYVLRLPTEAEWEYALKANVMDKDDLYFKLLNDQLPNIGDIGSTWLDASAVGKKNGMEWKDDYRVKGMAVGRKKPNRWGFYDMVGNIGEMMLDVIDANAVNCRSVGDENQKALWYDGFEVDPLRLFEGNSASYLVRNGHQWSSVWNRDPFSKHQSYEVHGVAFRIVLGPDLLKEKGIKFKPGK